MLTCVDLCVRASGMTLSDGANGLRDYFADAKEVLLPILWKNGAFVMVCALMTSTSVEDA